MPDIQYKKTIVDVIKDLLTDNLPGGYFRTFFYGDPVEIPTSLLPCVMIKKNSTKVTHGPTGMDRIETDVTIKLAYNGKDDLGKSPEEVVGTRMLEEYAEAVDESTNEYATNSVMGILRKNFTMGNVVLNQDHNINYGVVPRPGEEFTVEAHVRVSFLQLRTVTGRV